MLDVPTATLRTVTLPGGDTAEISDTPLEWWFKANASGFVAPTQIAPDPKNPRLKMSPMRQKEIEESIAAQGVRQPLVVTPRHLAPWATVAPEYESLSLLAVSGHRRRLGSINVDLAALPILVRVYPSEKEHRLDMALLNKGQDDLSPLEEGAEFLSLQELGWKIKELCDAFGYAAPQLYDRMHLTRLDPSIQKWLDPDLPTRQQLAITLGGALGGIPTPTLEEVEENYENFRDAIKRLQPGEIVDFDKLGKLDGQGLCFALQRLLYAVIKLRGMTAQQGVEFIIDRKLQLASAHGAGGKPTRRFEPHRRKDTIDATVSAVTGSLLIGWLPSEWRRIFELSSRSEVDAYIAKLTAARDALDKFISFLAPIRDGKKEVNAEVEALVAKGIAARKAASGKT